MIFKKIKIGRKILNNKIVVSPMCQYSSNNGSPTLWHYKHLGSMISSGASMLIIESTAVSREGRITEKDLCLFNKKHFEDLKKLVKYLKSINNIPICIQLSHAGRKGSSYVPWIKNNSPLTKSKSWETISASRIKKDHNWPFPKVANKKDIKKIINDFVESSKLALKAGFDGIELHMAHGYLIHQFLSPISNHRTDNYGGSFKNRNLLAFEIVKKIKKINKKNFFLGARITGSDHVKNGINVKQAISFSKELEKHGLNYICVSSGGIKTKTNLNLNQKGIRVNLAKKIKANTKKITIGTTGNLSDFKYLNKILKNQLIDLAFIGRPFLKNPHWMYQENLDKKNITIIPKQYLRAII